MLRGACEESVTEDMAKTGGKKQAAKTKEHMSRIIEYIEMHGESGIRDLANHIDLGLSRTRTILSSMDEIEPHGESRARVYRLKKDKSFK